MFETTPDDLDMHVVYDVRLCVCERESVRARVYVRACERERACARACTCVCERERACARARTCVCVRAFLEYVCACVYVCVLFVYVCVNGGNPRAPFFLRARVLSVCASLRGKVCARPCALCRHVSICVLALVHLCFGSVHTVPTRVYLCLFVGGLYSVTDNTRLLVFVCGWALFGNR